MGPHSGERPGLVPFQNFFAVLGYAVFCCVLIVCVAEGAARIAWPLYENLSSPFRRAGPAKENLLKHRRGGGGFLSSLFSDPWLDATSANPAYDGYAWAEEFWKEQRARVSLEDSPPPYEPFRIWGTPKLQGKYFNVDETPTGTFRRTANVLRPGCEQQQTLKVWFFGGSTAWGPGVPDFATIQSYLSEKLNADSESCVEVINMGVDGYASNQELIYLYQNLKAGLRPDVVIFYDGYNDAHIGSVDPGIPAAHWDYPLIKAKFESSIGNWPNLNTRSYLLRIMNGLRRRYQRHGVEPPSEQGRISRARATLDNYDANLRLVELLVKQYGFHAHFFWQPCLVYGAKPLAPFERALHDMGTDHRAIQAVYEEAERRSASSGRFIFLGDVFGQTREPVYIDWVHLAPRGNELVAAAIGATLQPALRGALPAANSNPQFHSAPGQGLMADWATPPARH